MKMLRLRFLVLGVLGCLAAWLAAWAVTRLYFEDEDRSLVTYSLIQKNLYMGGLVPVPPPGTQAVLNLCEHEDPYRCDVHFWKKLRDAAPAPTLGELRALVEFVDQQQKAGRVTYVHCWQGASRSGMVVIAYLMYEKNWPRDQALEWVRSRRPETRPNPAFMQLLLEWERELTVTHDAQTRTTPGE